MKPFKISFYLTLALHLYDFLERPALVHFLGCMMKSCESTLSPGSFDWDLESEIKLFHALMSHKPVGVDRHFQMIYIMNYLSTSLDKPITASQVWKRLSEMYDMDELQEAEVMPFPTKLTEFALSSDFDQLKEVSFPRAKSLNGDSLSSGNLLNHIKRFFNCLLLFLVSHAQSLGNLPLQCEKLVHNSIVI
ncbi:unnamed protein product [Protopolystoma xenopodis]|uniref:Uncharacterized protein n=1 Tax=Protopolystoma xenopodis TaxID=117903 RepID=A0A3S5BM97_9PLAT|nr:unnamed protein product [Protopolystoma xenopodis]